MCSDHRKYTIVLHNSCLKKNSETNNIVKKIEIKKRKALGNYYVRGRLFTTAVTVCYVLLYHYEQINSSYNMLATKAHVTP